MNTMDEKNIRQKALKYDNQFQNATSGDYSDEKYQNISNIVAFMKNHTGKIQSSYDKVIFLIGPTGAGKSTLMNYLFKDDNLLVSEYGKIYAKDSIADIGDGTSGSTTIFPNTWKHSDIEGIFIDCAGDFDTNGVLIEAINSKIKTLMANSVKSAKILLVTTQASLGAEAAYGKIFKEALDVNAKFFNDINHFKDNIVIVISQADRNAKVYERIGTLLDNMMEQISLSNYTDTVKHVIEQKNIVGFCKPSEEASPGSLYKAPEWNFDERKLIINKIEELNFIDISQKDFFNISLSLDVKRQMEKALAVVKMKAVQILTNAVKEAITPKLVIYATELKLFADFLKQLVTKNVSAGLEEYIKYLNYNNFLPISINPEVISKLTGELEYLESFTNDLQNSNREKGINYEWNYMIGIPSLLHDIQEEVIAIINKSSNLFTAFGSYNNLIVKSGFSDSESVKKMFKELHDMHEKKSYIESLKHNTNSEYYDDVKVKEFDRMEKEVYTRTENYTVHEPCTRTEFHEVDVPYTETENYTEEVIAPIRTSIWSLLTLGIAPAITALLTGNPTMHDTEEKSRVVTRYKKTVERKEVQDTVLVEKTREVEDYKEKPVYKYVTRRQFNESKYNEDIGKTDEVITKLGKDIEEILTKTKLANQNIETKFSEDVLSKIKMSACESLEEIKFTIPLKDLYEQWEILEYESLFLRKPDMSLDINNMELLLVKDTSDCNC